MDYLIEEEDKKHTLNYLLKVHVQLPCQNEP
jgi:hypothetical protein